VVFFHQGGGTIVESRISRYQLGNSIGNPTERALTFATLVFGGVMDACPDLKPLLAHGGGYTVFGAPRMDKAAGALEGGFPETGLEPPFPGSEDITLDRAPSDYLDRFYYDCCLYDEAALRFLIDRVGIDRVLFGTDYPAPMELLDPVRWIQGMDLLTSDEKAAILSGTASALLGLE
jgi:aminocarboxymuconate-semialdehyde decarboxylase